ncbi:MAG TPA: DUF4136 domain-containing protein [Pseudomonadales bacterium]|nr:DUF4136 domain-containing protein [Pseudomonadales bacterium]
MMNLQHRRNSQYRSFFLCAFLVSLLGCSTSSNHMEIEKYSTDVSADFRQLKTYRWDFTAMGKSQPEGGHLAEFDRVLCEHVDRHMAQMGYTRVEKGATDFVLDYRVIVKQEQATTDATTSTQNEENNPYGWRWSINDTGSPTYQGLQAPKTETQIYRTGTLHMAAVDKQGHIIWHSSATRLLSEHGNEAERRAGLRIAVNKLMATFPSNK